MPKENRKQLEVFEACDRLHQRGENITIDAVGRELLDLGYKRGSNSHVGQYVKTWRQNQGYSQAALATLPQRSDKFIEMIDSIRAEAYLEARQELDSYKMETEKIINTLNETIQYSQQEIMGLRKTHELMQQEQIDLTDKLQHFKKENDSISKLLKDALLTHDNEKKSFEKYEEHSKSEIDRLSKQHEQLALLEEKLLDNHKQELSILLDKYETERHQRIVQIDEARVQISKLEKSNAAITHDRNDFERENQRLNEELKQSRNQQEQLENKLNNINKTIEEHYKQWEIQYQTLPKYIEERFTTLKGDIRDNFSKIPDTTHEIKQIQQQITKLLGCFENYMINCNQQNNHDTE